MLKVNKIEVLNTILENCERKIIDIKCEIRLLERRKLSARGNQLIALENQIRGDKDMVGFYDEKIDVVKDEIDGESKRNTTVGSPAKKGA